MQVCHARNSHGRSLEEVRNALAAMEPIPLLYPQLDGSSLLHRSPPERKQVPCAGSCLWLISGLVITEKNKMPRCC